MKYFPRTFLPFIFLILFAQEGVGQATIGGDEISFDNPKEYEIGGITVNGTKHLDRNVLILLSGISVGEKIMVPGEKISKAIENLWAQGLFSDIKITASKIQGNLIFLEYNLEERPRLSKFSLKGAKKADTDEIRDEIKLIKGKVVTDNLLASTKNTIINFYKEKGYLNIDVIITQTKDTTLVNHVFLDIQIKKNGKIRINDIGIYGNTQISDGKLRRSMKDTKHKRWYTIFSSSKYLEENYIKDKQNLIAKYNEKGFRDARIISDSVYRFDKKHINIDIHIEEGKKYYFRNIQWVGNTKHSSQELSQILGVKKGDIFSQSYLDKKLFMNPEGRDVSSLYMDDGYLFFSVTPVEIAVVKDSIDLEMRIVEGRQARINKVYVTGNTKTNDHVIMREIRTKPGQLFSRADIIRSQRELSQLRYFNAEKLGVNPKPDPASGTVDIEYVVEEAPSDQIELSGGWGGGRVVGTLGVSFNNFSARNFFKGEAWRPLPAGDGQSLSLRAQSNGLYYQSYNLSFVEPWLGGKKPNSFSTSLYHSIQSNGEKVRVDSLGTKVKNIKRESIKITGLSFGLGKRLKWPDDYFTVYHEISLQHYLLDNYGQTFLFSNGNSNNFSYRWLISRNSIDQPIYPRSGSQISLGIQATPPYSLFFPDRNYATMTDQEIYQFVEYHKWKINASWFTKLAGNLVLNTKMGTGFLGFYNKEIGQNPFERFYLGGDGLSGFALDGREIIGLRGYDNGHLSAQIGSSVVSKYTMELRYPVSLNPSATIYGLTFIEGGYSWKKFNEYDPFRIRRSAGAGVRIFLPMFGLLGLDWGYRFDEPYPEIIDSKKHHFHFSIGANFNNW